tara:strand:- start:2562 stop:3077 length:516 start_codon:yes stop_codon:yes gene_type:complete
MSFNCSIFLEDIDINCNKSNAGGIKKVVLGLQKDLNLAIDPNDETLVLSAQLLDHVIFKHNPKDSATVFNESKTNNNGLGLITTNIVIRIPSIDRRMNKIDYMSRRSDIVAILYHNNGTATISGWMDGLTMNYSATSGSSISELSLVDIELVTDSWIASFAVDNANVIDLD